MNTTRSHLLARSLATLAITTLLAACMDGGPLAPARAMTTPRTTRAAADEASAVATLRRVTARYQDLDVALDDDFVLLHECESRPGEGPVGSVYVQMDRLLDGVVDPALPDALIYEPSRSGRPKLVGVEFAVLDAGQQAPSFLGEAFQREAEFGVFALHAWVWLNNPEGMFAQANPRVSCGEE